MLTLFANYIYFNHSKRKIKSIRKNILNLSASQYVNRLRVKGGVTLTAPVLFSKILYKVPKANVIVLDAVGVQMESDWPLLLPQFTPELVSFALPLNVQNVSSVDLANCIQIYQLNEVSVIHFDISIKQLLVVYQNNLNLERIFK